MGYSLGIDVGTTFTAAAVWRDERVELVALEAHRVTVPTVIAASEEVAFGDAALSRAGSAPDSVAREFKRRLGDPVPVFMSGSPYSAERLIALFAKWVTDVVSTQFGERPERIVLTYPANWTEFQQHLLLTALEQAGLGSVDLLTEPQAAALDFSATVGLERGSLVLVYDLGGGTFDLALLQREEVGVTHVGESAGIERLGGIDFDEAIFQHVLGLLPPDIVTSARNDPTGRLALAQLRTRCVEAKEALSSDVSADVPVLLPGLSSTMRITRAELESMIRPMLLQTIELVRQVLERTGVGVEQLSAVLMVGGSSRIPLVSELVGSELHAPIRVDAHPKLVVARGAARWAATRPAKWAPPTAGAAAGGGEGGRRRWPLIAGAVVVMAALAVGGFFLFHEDETKQTATPTATSNLPPSSESTTGAPTTAATTSSTTSVSVADRIVVPATTDWTDSGVDLEQGEVVEVRASGTVIFGVGRAPATPDGDPNPELRTYNVVGLGGVNHSSMIGRIGDDGTPFLLGKNAHFSAGSAGRLFLGINDTNRVDDSGAWVATVTVSRLGPVGSSSSSTQRRTDPSAEATSSSSIGEADAVSATST